MDFFWKTFKKKPELPERNAQGPGIVQEALTRNQTFEYSTETSRFQRNNLGVY